MRIVFHGAARSVTGSRHMVEINGSRILLDCGLFQGRRDEADAKNRDPGFDAAAVDAVILSHAHIDHSGALPALVKNGFEGEIHSTLATADLASIMLRDSGHIQEKDAEFASKRMSRRGISSARREPLYTEADAEKTLEHFNGHSYYRPFQVLPGVTATFHDAGHILGSALVHLQAKEDGQYRSILFTGDLGRPDLPIIRNPDRVPATDILIIESTYGDREHDPIENARMRLAEIIHTVAGRRGKLIIPAFAVGRTQDIVYELLQLLRAGLIPDMPIYVDSPLAVNATEVFERHPECYDDAIRSILRRHGDPFGFSRLRYIRRVEDSMELNTKEGPFVIVTASGMMEAGRVLHHLRNGIGDGRNAILIAGFMAENTLGRKILRGDREVNIFGEPHEVRAEVFVMNEFSAHGDRQEILEWYREISAIEGPPRDCFVVHGEEEQALALSSAIQEESPDSRVHVPHLHESFGLGGHDGRERRVDRTPARDGDPARPGKRRTRKSEPVRRQRGTKADRGNRNMH